MKIIRWFLSHFFLILLIVVVIYGYMFWGNLAGENTPAGKALAYLSDEFVEVEEFVNAVKAKQAKLSAEKQQSPAQKSDTASVEPETPAETLPPETLTVSKRDIEQQPVSISYSHNQMRVHQNSAGEIESQAEAPVLTIQQGETAKNIVVSPAAVAMADVQDKFISEQVEQQLDKVDKNGNVVDKSLQGEAIRDSWITARKSFYQRNYELSEKSYRDVIANTTDNFDAYGELGNVYFNQGKKQQAAAAYFEAASILVRKGQLRRAKSLMGLLKHLDNNRADDLQKLIGAG